MVADLVSLEDASLLIGISVERVRQLVVRGDLPGVRFGNAWAVPRASVMARRHQGGHRGRPLSAGRAWAEILGGPIRLENVGRYRNRAASSRYGMSPADAEYLVEAGVALRSGVAAAVSWGELLAADVSHVSHIDLYVSEASHRRMAELVAMVADPLGPVVVRVLSDEIWPDVVAASDESRSAPALAVALDLMDSGDPRHWIAGEHLASAHG